MKTIVLALIVTLSSIVALDVADVYSYPINPYLPHNAIAADPPTPYWLIDMVDIPKCSSKYYDPCPSCVSPASQFPDLTPVQQPFPGPFGIPVPVP